MFQHFLKQARHNSLFQAQMHIHINAIFYAYGLNSFVYVLVKLFVIDDKLVNELIRYNIAQSIDAQKRFPVSDKMDCVGEFRETKQTELTMTVLKPKVFVKFAISMVLA